MTGKSNIKASLDYRCDNEADCLGGRPCRGCVMSTRPSVPRDLTISGTELQWSVMRPAGCTRRHGLSMSPAGRGGAGSDVTSRSECGMIEERGATQSSRASELVPAGHSAGGPEVRQLDLRFSRWTRGSAGPPSSSTA